MGYYQKLDWEVVDYDEYCLRGMSMSLRGPEAKHLRKGEYIVCIGASQTFGRFCKRPYSLLLKERLKVEVLNLAKGAADAVFFQHEKLLEYINNSKLAIIQVMSGRSADNSLFRTSDLSVEVTMVSDGSKLHVDTAYKELLEKDIDLCKKIVAETRRNWVDDYKNLLEKIKVPTILLWFSKREPDYKEKYTDLRSLYGAFPQLVNARMINQIKKYSDEYVECVSRKGLPQPFISRFTGKPAVVGGKTENRYYPSQEMHMEAANLLEPICRKYLNENFEKALEVSESF
ncbi:MAG: hypothetical protein JRI96_16220 [Deltaproteobacteria bacterium]|nr:hypothetical protein [Deltaproteobacteria bacterium]